jgi:hypothetical protein
MFLQIFFPCTLLTPKCWRWMKIRGFLTIIVFLLCITIQCKLWIVKIHRRGLLLFKISGEWWALITEALVVLGGKRRGELLSVFFARGRHLEVVWEFMDTLPSLDNHNVTFLFSFFATVLSFKQFLFYSRFSWINRRLLILLGLSWWARAASMSVPGWLPWPFITLCSVSSEPVTRITSSPTIFNTSVSWFFIRCSPSIQRIMVVFFIHHIHSWVRG